MNEYLVIFSCPYFTYHFYGDSIKEVLEDAKRFLPDNKVVAVYECIFKLSSFSAEEVD